MITNMAINSCNRRTVEEVERKASRNEIKRTGLGECDVMMAHMLRKELECKAECNDCIVLLLRFFVCKILHLLGYHYRRK